MMQVGFSFAPFSFASILDSVMGNACSEGCFGMLGGAMQKELRACKKDPRPARRGADP